MFKELGPTACNNPIDFCDDYLLVQLASTFNIG
jgi:hypothetical protein